MSITSCLVRTLFPDKGSRLTIYEGELDAASGYAAMPTWPHVSLPDGAQSAKKALPTRNAIASGL